MRIKKIRVVGFRNLLDGEINTDAKDIFLVGKNGQGKSNFLEAVYFSLYASSFRGSQDKELLRDKIGDIVTEKQNGFSVYAELGGKTGVNNDVLIKFQASKKTITLNNNPVTERKKLLYLLPCVVFCHEEMNFVSGIQEKTRWFFDQNLCLYDSEYLDTLRYYKQILKTRNSLLRDCKERRKNNPNNNDLTDLNLLLDSVDIQFVVHGLKLIKRRKEEIIHFSKILNDLFFKVAGIKNLFVNYYSLWEKIELSEDEVIKDLKNKRQRDILIGTSMSGPHRDKYIFENEKQDFIAKASTGQRRLLALLLRVGQAMRYTESSGLKPVLLFDDVLLELDQDKKVKYLSLIPEYEQAFFTFLPDEPYMLYKKDDTLLYEVAGGNITMMEV